MYSILDPEEVPEIKGVTRLAELNRFFGFPMEPNYPLSMRFPGQEKVGGDCKIPTIIYYDRQGKVCAIGAEAVREGIEEEAEDREWTKAEW